MLVRRALTGVGSRVLVGVFLSLGLPFFPIHFSSRGGRLLEFRVGLVIGGVLSRLAIGLRRGVS